MTDNEKLDNEELSRLLHGYRSLNLTVMNYLVEDILPYVNMAIDNCDDSVVLHMLREAQDGIGALGRQTGGLALAIEMNLVDEYIEKGFDVLDLEEQGE